MDIEKICRCCLALNGPLLSIYDGDSAESGCVADMLREISKLKPQQNDNMPAKVCLSCISEINRCYVFKIKCENSNRTLWRLLPNAVKGINESPFQKLALSDAGTQTEENVTNSAHMQTLPLEVPAMVHRETQTDVDACCQKSENYLDLSPSRDIYLSDDVTEYSVAKRRLGSANTSSSTPTQISPTLKRLRYEDVPEPLPETDEYNEEKKAYIVVEAINSDSRSSVEQEQPIETISEHTQDDSRTERDSSLSQLEYYERLEEEKIEGSNRESPLVTEEIYSNITEPLNSVSQQSSATKPSLRSLNQRREQYKCSFCIMTFVSLKVLRRHLAKRHSVVDTEIIIDDTIAEDTSPTEEIEETIVYNSETPTGDHVELTVENVPNPRLFPRDRVSTNVNEQLYTKFKYYCGYCMAGFAQRKTLTYHMKQNVCLANNFKCNECDRIFISEENMEAHKETHNKEHTCLDCNKVCGTVEELSDHMIEEHNRNARNQCNICKKVFTMKASLMDHLRIHSGEKPFLCTVCGKCFRQNSNLRQHLMRHTNEKNFKCDMCPNAYVTKAELFSHKRKHTGDHPFKCEICSACFTSSSSLLKHKRKHTGERPYACEFCPMRFASLNVLKNHRRTHTGEKPYKCEFCDKSFRQKGDCLLHQRTHEFGDVKCFCGSKFTRICNWRQHIKSKHPNMTDEKRKELDESLKKRKSTHENGEIHITLVDGEDFDDEDVGDSGETVQLVTIHNDNEDHFAESHSHDNEPSEIIVEEINLINV